MIQKNIYTPTLPSYPNIYRKAVADLDERTKRPGMQSEFMPQYLVRFIVIKILIRATLSTKECQVGAH